AVGGGDAGLATAAVHRRVADPPVAAAAAAGARHARAQAGVPRRVADGELPATAGVRGAAGAGGRAAPALADAAVGAGVADGRAGGAAAVDARPGREGAVAVPADEGGGVAELAGRAGRVAALAAVGAVLADALVADLAGVGTVRRHRALAAAVTSSEGQHGGSGQQREAQDRRAEDHANLREGGQPAGDPVHLCVPGIHRAFGHLEALNVAAISVQGLVKRFEDVVAVNGISFDIADGTCVGLLGPNGAGKTTTVEILEGIQSPTSGEVRVLGRRWETDATAIRERIGLALQQTQFYERLTVRETVELFRSFYPRGLSVEEAVAKVQLQEKAKAFVMKLSGGQKQRLAVAVALVADPELLFLDEPTTGLDPQSRRSLWDVIDALRGKGRTVLL